MISDHVKNQTRSTLLRLLDEYFAEAEEHEDEEVQLETDSAGRVDDFVLYLNNLSR